MDTVEFEGDYWNLRATFGPVVSLSGASRTGRESLTNMGTNPIEGSSFITKLMNASRECNLQLAT